MNAVLHRKWITQQNKRHPIARNCAFRQSSKCKTYESCGFVPVTPIDRVSLPLFHGLHTVYTVLPFLLFMIVFLPSFSVLTMSILKFHFVIRQSFGVKISIFIWLPSSPTILAPHSLGISFSDKTKLTWVPRLGFGSSPSMFMMIEIQWNCY